jgi:acyl carrier protein
MNSASRKMRKLGLPWAGESQRELEAQRWAERSCPEAQSRCATRVALVLAEHLGNDLGHLLVNCPWQDFGEFNELNHVELLLALEREFGFSISDEDGAAMTTPGAIVRYVEKWTYENAKA